WPLKGSRERKSCMSLTLNKKLEMIMLSEDDISKADTGQKLGFLCQTFSQVVNANAKFLKEIKSKRLLQVKQLYTVELKGGLVVCIKDQTSHAICLGQSLFQKALTLFNSVKAERSEEAAEEKKFKERSCLHNRKVQGEALSSEELAKKLMKVATEQQIFNVDKTFYWKKIPSYNVPSYQEVKPGFSVTKDRLILLLGTNTAGDLKLKPIHIYHSENPGTLKNYAKSTLPACCKWNGKAWVIVHLFTAWLTECCKPTIETCLKKRVFKLLLVIDNKSGHPRALQIYKEIHVIFLLVSEIFILQFMDRVILTYYLRNTSSYYTVAAIDSNSFDGSGQSKWKIFWKTHVISREEIHISVLTGVWKKLIPILMDDFEEFMISMEEVTADVVEIARESEREAEPKHVIELLQSHDNTPTNEDLLPMDKQRKRFPAMESTHDEDTMNIVEMITKDLEYYLNVFDKALVGFNPVSKMISNNIACYRKIFCEKKIQLLWQSLLSYFKRLLQLPPSP
uniref:DDE-1 domain-containing protein n=1 Tax=Chlorocebus sabaeus TaxID=60711 RepID=A0A0D9S1G4_CHLSB